MKNVAKVIRTSSEFEEAINEAATQSVIVVDTEFDKNSKVDPSRHCLYGEARIIGVSWGYPAGSIFKSYYAPFRHRDFPTAWNLEPDLIEEFNRFPHSGTQVYHNWQADHKVLLQEGIDFSDRFIFDTMVAQHLCNENQESFKLDDLARRKFKARKLSLTDLERSVGWEHIHPLVMGEYACTDVFLTYRLYLDAVASLQHQKLEELYEDYERFIKILFKIVDRGLLIDVGLAKQMQDEGRREMQHLTDKYNFNLGSQQLVAKHLHETLGTPVRFRTGKGAPSTSRMHLSRYRDSDPESSEFTADVLQYRTLAKAVSTWYEGFVSKRGVGGLLHPGLTIVGGGDDDRGGTRTGRLSCREPNLQQVPRKGRVKELFKAPTGMVLCELDYSQAELRMTGHYMENEGAPTVADAYRRGVDIHSITAENMGLTVNMSHKEARQVGKTCNFSLCYRAGPEQLRTILYRDAGMDVDAGQAVRYHSAWHRAYPVVNLLNIKAQKAAEKRGYVRMWNGRRRHLQGNDCFKAYNSIIQGGVGQIMMYAMTKLGTEFPDLQVVNQVHDSVWLYLPEDGWEDMAKEIAELMANIPTQEFDLPFAVDYKLIGQVHA